MALMNAIYVVDSTNTSIKEKVQLKCHQSTKIHHLAFYAPKHRSHTVNNYFRMHLAIRGSLNRPIKIIISLYVNYYSFNRLNIKLHPFVHIEDEIKPHHRMLSPFTSYQFH